MRKILLVLVNSPFLTSAALAHEGHGLEAVHWHATDGWGFVVGGALIALALWLSRGGK